MDIETTNLINQITALEPRITALKAIEQRYIGERTGVQTRLKDEFSVKSVAQADAKLAELATLIAEQKIQLKNLVESVSSKVMEIENAMR
jgi:hypothetical protein